MVFNSPRRRLAARTQPTAAAGTQPTATGKIISLAFICATLVAAPLAARAAVTATDIQVIGRILRFTTPPLSGAVRMGIVYDPTKAISKADEQSLLHMLGAGLVVGDVTLVPVPVTLDDIARTKVDFLFLTAGLGAEGGKAGAQAASAKILCITTDLSATRAGSCAVSVETGDTVQITVNEAAATAAGIIFSSAFTMLTTQI